MSSYITEKNAERPASKKQLWALYCLTKKDYRNQDLTMLDASNLIKQFNASKVVSKIGVDTKDQVTKTSVRPKNQLWKKNSFPIWKTKLKKL